jgi:uncharacterized membrane protein
MDLHVEHAIARSMSIRPVTRALIATLAAAFLAAPAAHAQYTLTEIIPPGGGGLLAYGINNVGQVVGICALDSKAVGFLYGEGTFTPISVPGAERTYAWDVNDAGQVVGHYVTAADGAGANGFLYDRGTFTYFDIPGASWTVPLGINNLGQIVGRYGDPSDGFEHGFLYDHAQGVFTKGLFFAVDDLNDHGQIVAAEGVGFAGTGHGILYEHGVSARVDVPGALWTFLTGVNNLGEIAGHYTPRGAIGISGFVYRGGTFTTLDVPGATVTYPYSINDAGQLAVAAGGPDLGRLYHGFVATPVTVAATPEPETWVLLGARLLAIGGVARRRRRA